MEIWEEPVRGGYGPDWFVTMSGPERHAAWDQGFLPWPPIHYLTGATPVESGAGSSRCVMPATGWLLSPQGRIPLGALAILADLAFGTCFATSLPAGRSFTTAELSLTRFRDCQVGGNLIGLGTAVRVADDDAYVEARILDAGGRLVAAGTSRIVVLPPPPELPSIPDPIPRPEQVEHETPHPFERPPPTGVLDADHWDGRSGREVLDAHARGDLPDPPISQLTGLRVTDVADGGATITMPASEWLCSPARTVQGGVTALIADGALACAIQTTVERGDRFLPVDIKVNYLRPILPTGGAISATAEVTHRGRSIAVAHATVTDADGKRVALATGSAAIGPSA